MTSPREEGQTESEAQGMTLSDAEAVRLDKLWAKRDSRYAMRRLGAPVLTLGQERMVREWRWQEAMELPPVARGAALQAALRWTMPPRMT